MKKLIVAGVMALGFLSASAQNKIGYINTEELISVMPEADKANTELQEFQASLSQQYKDMMQELETKGKQFDTDSLKLTASMKEIKRGELMQLYEKAQSWNQQAQDMYQQKAQEKVMPIRAKAQEAIKAIAKENGYAYILDINAVIVGPPGDDVLVLVKKKLGIKDAPAATPKKPATGR
ncbi:MAG: OmpH family outer membrane protein [Chitinophagaceae bacterium]|nr:OmpH family outer membrane protein [Chitinophagaceae bacterium]